MRLCVALRYATPLRALLALAVAATCFTASAEPPRKHYYKSFLGEKPPELRGSKPHWVNQRSPVTLEKLHGRVVWLEFNF